MEASYDLGIFLAERSKAIAQLVQSIGTNWSHGSALGTNTTQKRIVLECSRVKFSAKMAKTRGLWTNNRVFENWGGGRVSYLNGFVFCQRFFYIC